MVVIKIFSNATCLQPFLFLTRVGSLALNNQDIEGGISGKASVLLRYSNGRGYSFKGFPVM